MRFLCIFLTSCLFVLTSSQYCHAKPSPNKTKLPEYFFISKEYAKNISNSVDKLVRKNFFDKTIVKRNWAPSYQSKKEKILNSKTLKELTDNVNECLKSLNTSHCRILSLNDETYHFLKSLFGSYSKEKNVDKGVKLFIGFVAGGPDKVYNTVRFVLNDSPASKAGIKIGDKLVSVNGVKYFGYINFISSGKQKYDLTLDRKGKLIKTTLEPQLIDVYSGYTKCTRASAKTTEIDGLKIGYFHLWTGGNGCHEALNDALCDELKDSDGLILDLRSGYGANDLVDLDRFYRDPANYPDLSFITRKGKVERIRYYYEKPLVAIINGGSRSGKELIAYSLKKSGRAKLVGTTTSGSVVAGKLFKVDKYISLYLAINDVKIDGKRLEGSGVAPDFKVSFDQIKYLEGKDSQLSKAKEILLRKISDSK